MRWRRLDPRSWATAHPKLTVAVFGLATCVMVYGNVVTEKGGVLDDPILDSKSPACWLWLAIAADRFHTALTKPASAV